MGMKIAVAGSTGFVGSRLVASLQAAGHDVIALTRNVETGQRVFPTSAFAKVEVVAYDPSLPGEWQQAIDGCDGVINLAGEPIAEKRWTPEHKQLILESRQLATRNLVEAIAQAKIKPQVLVNASAIGYYGTSETDRFDENSAAGSDFLAEVCKVWEQEARVVEQQGTRLVICRIGIVLGNGGAMAKMLPVFKVFAGGPLGSGQQWFSWISREDLVKILSQAVTDSSWRGVYNATAPNPVRMGEFCKLLGDQMKRPSWLPVPAIALQTLLGDGAAVVLEGQQVMPQRTLAQGFEYQYPEAPGAIAAVLKETP
jgi:uncharacterized protein